MAGAPERAQRVDDVFLRTSGAQIVTRAGRPVRLKGTALGGWMNMENYVTGYAGSESLVRASLCAALGDELYLRFFDRWLDVFFADEDAAFLASLGLNCVRLPVNYRHFEDDAAPFELKEEGFRVLDRAIERCACHGLYTIVDLHAAPGFQNQHWHCDNPTHRAFFWEHRHFQDRVVHLWEAIARRYRENPWVAGYNPLNEPGDVEGKTLGAFYERLYDAVRAIDAERILFLEGNRYSRDFSVFREVWPNTVYTFHHYPRSGYVDGGEYPGTTKDVYVDASVVEQQFLERTAFMREHGVPIWLGEFGPVYVGDERIVAGRYEMLEDQFELVSEHGVSWSMFTYKDIGVMGLVYLDPETPYMRRIRPVLEKKLRLGADWWAATDEGIRQVMDPLERIFAEEFPAFDPYPFGTQNWLEGLIRSIVLSEPLAEEFGRCFAGATAEDVDALADSFRLEHCIRRDRLVELLKRVAREQ
jgi:hypothetical protein